MLPPVRRRLPEYNVAVDRYADWVVVQEYRRQKLLMRTKRVSVCSILSLNHFGTGDCAKQTGTENPRTQKGKNQYQKLGEKGEFLEVTNITLTCG